METAEIKSKYELLITSFLIVICVFLIVVIIYFAVQTQNNIKAGQYIGQDVASRDTITATGTGEIYAKPDLASMTFSVISEGKTVNEAMADNVGKMNAVIASVKSQGVEEKDVVTAAFNISPRYDYMSECLDMTMCKPGERRVLAGYDVNQSLMVKIRDLAKVGTIIEGATAAGANQSGDLSFTIDDPDSLTEEARAKAIKDAKEKAAKLAAQLGVKLVKITGFNENGYRSPIYSMKAEMADVTSSGAIPSIETGQNKIEVSVNLTYEIR